MDYEEMLERGRKNLPEIKISDVRFEIPSAIVSMAGKQTVIRNFSTIGKALRRDEKHFAKFLFKELAAPGNIKEGELFLLGKINTEVINKRVNEYAREFVICHECGKPDTRLEKINGSDFIKCEACGAKRPLKGV